MIYMVEMDMKLGDREAEWHAWYLAHIRVLLTVPGFRASQRFQSLLPCPAPYLALHQVDSGAIFESPEYRSRGGPGPAELGPPSPRSGSCTGTYCASRSGCGTKAGGAVRSTWHDHVI